MRFQILLKITFVHKYTKNAQTVTDANFISIVVKHRAQNFKKKVIGGEDRFVSR